jgi:TolB-like protein
MWIPKQATARHPNSQGRIAVAWLPSALRVISRTSEMRFKRTQKSIPEIARELNVDAIMEGSVERAGNRVRITAQLIRAATDQNLWAESYDRDMQDMLRVQEEIASSIAHEVQIQLTPQSRHC